MEGSCLAQGAERDKYVQGICSVAAREFMGVELKRNSIGRVNATSERQKASGHFMLCMILLLSIITNTDNVSSAVQKNV